MNTLRRLILTSLLVVFLCPFASYAKSDEASMLEIARQQYQTGSYYFATTWLERILKSYPATTQREEVLVMMSKSYASTNREKKAAQALLTLLKDYPNAAATLDPELLKLVEYSKPPVLAVAETAETAVPTAPTEAAVKMAATTSAAQPEASPLPPAAPPVTAEPEAAPPVPSAPPATSEATAAPEVAVLSVQEAPKPVEPPPVSAPPPVLAVGPAPEEAVLKTAPLPLAEEPATREVPAGNTAKVEVKAYETGVYTLEIGEYVLMSAMDEAKRKIKKVGLSPQVEPGQKRKEPMIRLYVGGFPNQQSASKVLGRLRAANTDSFVLMEGARFQVYAGSYFDQKGATREQRRLAALGLKLTQKKTVVSVPTYLLTASSFPTRDAAMDMALQLEMQGLKSVVTQRTQVR